MKNPMERAAFYVATFVAGALVVSIPSLAAWTPQYSFPERPMVERQRPVVTQVEQLEREQVEATLSELRETFQEESFEERQTALLNATKGMQAQLATAEDMVNANEELSESQKKALLTAIDSATTNLGEIQTLITSAEDVEDLYAVYATFWVWTNEDYAAVLRDVVSVEQAAQSASFAQWETMQWMDERFDLYTDEEMKAAEEAYNTLVVEVTEADAAVLTYEKAVEAADASIGEVETVEDMEEVGVLVDNALVASMETYEAAALVLDVEME